MTDADVHLRDVPVDAMRRDFETGVLRKVITTVWKEGVDFSFLEVLIRADGMTGEIPNTQIVGRLSRNSQKSTGILVDFIDQYGEWFENRSRTRMEQYSDKGWNIVENWDPSW